MSTNQQHPWQPGTAAPDPEPQPTTGTGQPVTHHPQRHAGQPVAVNEYHPNSSAQPKEATR